ncbi:hypothetical protein AHAS_Ahas09G0174300 [Arachis hypogaea]
MYYHEESIHSYVKGNEIHLNKESLSDALDYYDVGVNAYISKKWNNDLGISHKDVLANICENISLMDVLYAILNKTEISFAYLMMRHMHDCIKSDTNISLLYGIFLTCIFEYFDVDLNNEHQENRISSRKDGGAVKQTKRKRTKATRDMVMEKKEDESTYPPSAAGTSNSNKYLINRIVKDVLQEFVNLIK